MSFTIAATTAFLGLGYQYIFILRPDDLEWRAIPLVSLIQWVFIGLSIGFVIPEVYEISGDLALSCILSFGAAIIGMVVGQVTLEALRSLKHKKSRRAYQQVITERAESKEQ